MSERDWEAERSSGNRDAIRRMNARFLIDPVHRVKRQKGVARREEKRAESIGWGEVTLKMCFHPRCRDLDHYRVGPVPVRLALNSWGNWVVWLPEEVLPRTCQSFGRFGLSVHRGSVASYQKGRRKPGSVKWHWSLLGRSLDIDMDGLVDRS